MNRSTRPLSLLVTVALALMAPGCGQEIFVFDGGSTDDAGPEDGGTHQDGGGDADAGPVLAGIVPQHGYAAEGVTGATWSGELRVRLAWADSAPAMVEVVSSNPGVLSVADGGAIVVPAGETEAPIIVSGHAQNAQVWLTARRFSRVADAGVRVLGALEEPAVLWLSPDAGAVASGETIAFTFALEFPAPAPVPVAVSVSPPGLGTVPATVVVGARQTDGGFTFTAFSGGAGTVSVSAASSASSNVTVLAPVISEIAAFAPDGGSNEFVELYNPTGGVISLRGWKLDHRSSSGGVGRFHEFHDDAEIAPHGYFLVGHELFSGQPDERLTKDGLPQTGRQMSASDATLYLVNASDGGVDRLGWGSSTPEGSPATPASGYESMERKANAASTSASMTSGADVAAGNGQDTQNNSADFIVRPERDPQNSTSPPEP